MFEARLWYLADYDISTRATLSSKRHIPWRFKPKLLRHYYVRSRTCNRSYSRPLKYAFDVHGRTFPA